MVAGAVELLLIVESLETLTKKREILIISASFVKGFS